MKTRILAPDQIWDKKTLKKIRKEDNVIYDGRAVHAVQIIPRKNDNPLIKLTTEDDGFINFESDRVLQFDAFWIDSLIHILEETKSALSDYI